MIIKINQKEWENYLRTPENENMTIPELIEGVKVVIESMTGMEVESINLY